MSADNIAQIEGVAKGMFGAALGDRERIFLVDLDDDSFLFADIVDGSLTNVASIMCG